MIKWKDEYSIGVKLIDEQHRQLFAIAGRAYDLLKDDFRTDKYDQILSILEELKQYTIYHFQSEEGYMMNIKYKKLLSHKVVHDDFIEKISNLDLRKVDDNQEKYLLDILEFVVDWIDKHILGMDKLIGQNL